MKFVRVLILSLFLLPLAAFGRAAPLIDPPPIDVPAKVTTAKVEKIVKEVLIAREWIPRAAGAGKIEAVHSGGNFSAKIEVSYAAKRITIKYLDSINLHFEDKAGTRYIHGNYNKWINNLVKDLNLRLAQESFSAQ